MPKINMDEIRERAKLLAAPARTPESGQVLEPPSDAAAQRQRLQDQRGALNADSAPPGQEPVADPIDAAFHAGTQHPRGSDQAVQAFTQEIFNAAQAGDPRVMSQGTIDDETRRRWHDDAHARQVANRNASGAAHR